MKKSQTVELFKSIKYDFENYMSMILPESAINVTTYIYKGCPNEKCT